MADRYFINGGVDNNWGTTPLTNWSTTDGGVGGASVPTSSDAVKFTNNSPNCTVNTSARVCQSLDCTGYTSTLAMAQNITVSGSVTLSATMTITGSGILNVSLTATLTSNGKTWPTGLTFSGAVTYTLADNWNVDGPLVFGNNVMTLNGFQINAGDSVTHSATTSTVSGTTLLVLDGTGTLTGATGSGRLLINITINTSGTIIFAAANFRYITGTFTYISGTVVTVGSTFICSADTDLDLNGLLLDNVTFTTTGTVTITNHSPFVILGLLTLGTTTSALVINGSSIECRGGIRQAQTTGHISGTTQFILTDTQTLDGPSITIGRIFNPIEINAPGDTITIDAYFAVDLSQLLLTAGTVITDAGTWASGGATPIFIQRTIVR